MITYLTVIFEYFMRYLFIFLILLFLKENLFNIHLNTLFFLSIFFSLLFSGIYLRKYLISSPLASVFGEHIVDMCQ